VAGSVQRVSVALRLRSHVALSLNEMKTWEVIDELEQLSL
jgi:hypothetical protein